MMPRARSTSPWERLPEVNVTTEGPFAVGGVLWRDARGKLMCTIVAKATYELVPGESAPSAEPLPIQEDDVHWDDDPSRSVHVPSDLAPFKSAAEVVVVGSAFAPGERPARSVTARVVVGSVDKSIDCFPPRRFRLDGAVDDAAPLVRFSLRYEHAAGGADNPAGVDLGRGDARGRLPIPALLPASFTLGAPGDHIPVAGLGPIAAAWPSRGAGLGPHDRAWILRPAASPLPQTLPARQFQAAPPDQWLDRALAANDRVVLEGLHAQHARLVMSLSGLEPRALVAGRDPLRLTGDLLFVDTDRKLCTLTFRGVVPVADDAARLRAIVVGAPLGVELSTDSVRGILGADDDAERLPLEPEDLVVQTHQVTSSWMFQRPALPFLVQAQAAAPTPRPSVPDLALPFRGKSFEHKPYASASDPTATAVLAPPTAVVAPPAPLLRPELSPAPEPARPVFSPPPSPGTPGPTAQALTMGEPPKPPVRPVSKPSSFDAAFGGKSAVAFGGVLAASDAAAGKEGGKEPAASTSKPPDEQARRLRVLDLLSFDPRLAAHLRGMRRLAPVWAGLPAPKRAPQSVDEARAEAPSEARDRADVLRVLSYGRPEGAAAVRRALAESLEEIVDLEPPVVLVAGELRPTFDETETLRTTVAVAQPVAGTDKKLLAAIAVAQDALAATIAPRPDATLGLARQIEQATASLSLPPRYVAAEVERLMLEGRKYRRRPLSGEARVRGELSLTGAGGESMVAYLPDAVATSLPLMLAFPVVALCAVRPREDVIETAEEALFVMALGRVLSARGGEERG